MGWIGVKKETRPMQRAKATERSAAWYLAAALNSKEEIPHLPNFPVANFEGLPYFWSNPNLSTPNRTQMVNLRFLLCFHSWAGCMGPWHQAESSGHILGFPFNLTLRYLTIPEDTFGLFLPHLFTVDPKIAPVLQTGGFLAAYSRRFALPNLYLFSFKHTTTTWLP